MGDVIKFPSSENQEGLDPVKPYDTQLYNLLKIIAETHDSLIGPLAVSAKKMAEGDLSEQQRLVIAEMLLKSLQCLREISTAIKGM